MQGSIDTPSPSAQADIRLRVRLLEADADDVAAGSSSAEGDSTGGAVGREPLAQPEDSQLARPASAGAEKPAAAAAAAGGTEKPAARRQFSPGQEVELHGLKKAEHLNLKRATVVRFLKDTGRFRCCAPPGNFKSTYQPGCFV